MPDRRLLREVLLAAVGSTALAVVMTWPTLLHPASTVPADTGDPLLQVWQLAWGGHALRHAPKHPFDANAFWPLHPSLAFSDSLLGYAPAGLIGSGPSAALIRYNLLFVFAFALAFFGAYLLARQLGVRSPAAAAVAGAAFGYAPWRITQSGHLHILSAGGIPLSLALLLRGHARQRPPLVLAGWAVACWQLSIGFGLGLPFAYGLAVIAGVTAVYWLAVGRPPLPRRLLLADSVGALTFLLVGLTLAAPYLAVARAHPEAERTAEDVALFSPPLRGFLIAPEHDWLWGARQARLRSGLAWQPEMAMAVGGTVVVLAVAGLLLATWSWRRRLLLAGTAVVAVTFAAGTTLYGGRYTYLPLLHHAPGWNGIRTPGRLVLFASVALGLLAAGGVAELARRWPPAGWLSVALVLLEGVSTIDHPRPEPPPAAFLAAAGPVLVLPSDPVADDTVMFWSTAGFPALVNGSSGFVPAELSRVRARAGSFPAPAAVRYLRALGVRSVVVRPRGNAPAPAADSRVTRTAYADGSVGYAIAP